MQNEFVKIPTPPDGKLQSILSHSETRFRWFNDILIIVNPYHGPMMAKFENITDPKRAA